MTVTMTMTSTIEIAGLTKSYADHAVLGGVDLSVPFGTIFALLGSNSAGKTTVVKILSTLLKADGGTAVVNRTTSLRRPEGTRISQPHRTVRRRRRGPDWSGEFPTSRPTATSRGSRRNFRRPAYAL